eukprot:5192063-Prymnesium_polylepis.1
MLAREYCDAAGIKLKPVILSHHMLYGLAKGQAKMSKSDRDSAIFMEDSEADVKRKIEKAYCPRQEGEVAEKPPEESMQLVEDKLKNPCLDYVQHIVFAAPDATFATAGATFSSFEAVRDAFLSEKLSEEHLKAGLIEAVRRLPAKPRVSLRARVTQRARLARAAQLNKLLEPVRSHFDTDPEA